MRLSELSERSGITTATIKYYLREGLLPPGRRLTATQADYGEDHLRRLRLVRALIQVGKVPVATAREVLAAVEDESLDHHMRLGAAVWALPQDPGPVEEDPETAAARRTADELLRRLDWRYGLQAGASSPAYAMLVNAIAALARLGYPHGVENVLPYARLAGELAVADLDLVEEFTTPIEQVEAAVALTVLYEPVLLSLRRLAEAEESHKRFGAGK
ncbi:MerR family transcriptional regulator [Streptomyces sp. MST-110588]|uniref:MerR family transcriptional regulator n=1 Tax=Streptomyces sp. MST-110588 TaxID=2833628 RepID=UPI001F5CFCCD|nr:MerR family transcriptional regulator [Streptomyces sp. MST-110588]UNO43801.1 MerR family transcriptional regulator [Streptomyces sp. MST-110588]